MNKPDWYKNLTQTPPKAPAENAIAAKLPRVSGIVSGGTWLVVIAMMPLLVMGGAGSGADALFVYGVFIVCAVSVVFWVATIVREVQRPG